MMFVGCESSFVFKLENVQDLRRYKKANGEESKEVQYRAGQAAI